MFLKQVSHNFSKNSQRFDQTKIHFNNNEDQALYLES